MFSAVSITARSAAAFSSFANATCRTASSEAESDPNSAVRQSRRHVFRRSKSFAHCASAAACALR